MLEFKKKYQDSLIITYFERVLIKTLESKSTHNS